MNRITRVIMTVALVSSVSSIACGESIYLNRGPTTMYYNVLESRDAATSDVVTTYPMSDTMKRAGLGLSPDQNILYSAAYSTGSELWSFNAATGAYINKVTVSSDAICRGLAVDPATGNVYVSLTGSIAQITPGGVVNASWGTGLTVADLEIYDGKLYGGGYTGTTSTKGVFVWDLNTGGTPSVLGGTGGKATYGLAFAPDGTLFTSAAVYATYLSKWDATYSTASNFGSFPNSIYIVDMDVINGNLYVPGRKSSGNYGEILKIDPATGDTATWISFQDGDFYTNWLVGEQVPEPSTLALLTAGLIGLLAYAWKKRK